MLDEAWLKRFLLQRLKQQSAREPPPEQAVTRRQMFVAAGAATAAMLAGGAFAIGALRVRRQGRSLEVLLAGHSWLIDPNRFGLSTQVHWRRRRDEHHIRLAGARLPGTDLDLSFDARISPRPRGWGCEIAFHARAQSHQVDLEEWLATKTPLLLSSNARGLRLSPHTRLGGDAGDIALKPDLSVAITGRQRRPLELSVAEHTLRCRALHVVPAAGQSLARLGLDPARRERATAIELLDPVGCLEQPLLGIDARHTFGLRFERITSGTVVAGDDDARTELLLEGAGTLRRNSVEAEHQFALRWDRIAQWQQWNGSSSEGMIAGDLSGRSFGVNAGPFVVAVSGQPNAPALLRMRDRQLSEASLPARLHDAYIPTEGADTSRFTFAALPVEMHLTAATAPLPAVEEPQKLEAVTVEAQLSDTPVEPAPWMNSGLGYIVLDAQSPYFLAPLAKAKLHIGRGRDLLDLGFGFRNYAISTHLLQPRLIPTVSEAQCQAGLRPQIIVTFPPQHVQEQAFERQIDGFGASQQAPGGPIKFQKERPVDARPWAPAAGGQLVASTPPAFEPVVRARASGRSRLVFETCPPVRIPLTVDDLTDWSQMSLVVNKRALPPTATLSQQLDLVKIAPQTKRADAFSQIAKSLEAPGENETSIEFPCRLLLSPDQAAHWETPRGRPPMDKAVLWHARLVETNRSSVRALWARGINLGFLTGQPTNDQLDPSKLSFSLAPSDRRQLVSLSSLYGLPALRSLKTKLPVEQDLNSTGAATSGAKPSQDDLNGTVARPDTHYDYLNGDEEGIWIPKPLDLADMVLTPLGATCDLEWKGEPPAPQSDPKVVNWSPAVAVERWRHQAVLGRDVYVQVAYKGFLMPLGHRAALVKVTERHFYRNPVQKTPTAYLIQRRFIVINKPNKLFPALYQPFEGRPFPASQVQMLTQRTADLVNPEAADVTEGDKNGRVFKDGPGLVFWPRTKPRGADEADGLVSFEWRVNADAAPIRSPLMFVDNAAVHDPDRLQQAIDAYNAAAEIYRTSQHGGAGRRYAPEVRDGDTRYDTSRWRLLAMPPMRGDAPSYKMDAAMEGQDQPPFYPTLERAFITIQSVDRLLGKPQGQIEVGIDLQYINSGFDRVGNPAELFLDVFTPKIYLELGSQGDSAGGVAKPSAALAALSRKTGLIGGKEIKPVAVAKNKALTMATGAGNSPYDISQASQGNFDPTEFFGALTSAKLLGILPLSTVISLVTGGIGDAPKLLETVQYKVGQATALQAMKDAADLALAAINTALEAVKAGAAQALAALQINIPWSDLYPNLADKFNALTLAIQNARAAISHLNSNDEFFSALAPVVPAIGAARKQIELLVENPTPALIQPQINDLQTILTGLEAVGRGGGVSFGEAVWKLIAPQVSSLCTSLPDDTRRLLFGSDSAACSDLANDPMAALQLIQETLFYDTFGKPLADMFAVAQRLRSQLEARLYLAVSELKDALLQAIHSAPDAVSDAQASMLADALASLVKTTLLATALGDDPSSEVERRLQLLVPAFRKEIQAELNDANLTDAIAPRVVAAVRALVASQINDFVRLLQQRTAAAGSGAATQIIETAQSAFDSFASSAEIGWINSALAASNQWCAAASGAVSAAEEFARAVASELIADDATIMRRIVDIDTALNDVELPAGSPQDAISAVARARAALAASYHALLDLLTQLQQARSELINASPVTNVCTQLASFLPGVDQIFSLRVRVVRNLLDATNYVVEIQKVIDALAAGAPVRARLAGATPMGAAWAAVPTDLQTVKQAVIAITNALAELLAELTSLEATGQAGSPVTARVGALIKNLHDEPTIARYQRYVGQLKDLWAQLQTSAASVLKDIKDAGSDPEKLRVIAQEVLSFAIEHDRNLAAVVLKSVVAGANVWTSLDTQLAAAIGSTAGLLAVLHETTAKVAQQMAGLLGGNLKFFIRKDLLQAISDAEQSIGKDGKALRSVQQAAMSGSFAAIEASTDLRKRWREGDRPIVKFVDVARGAIDSLVHGQLSAVFDFSGLQEALRNAVAQFVPAKIDLAYDWGTHVKDVGSSSTPLFQMLRGGAGTNPGAEDLTLRVRVSVDLLNQTRTAQASGELQPFAINLLDGSPDLVTISFKGARFSSGTGQATSFEAPIDDVQIGSALQFIEQLSSWLNPGGSGVYVEPRLLPPEIEVGWRYAAGIIIVGEMQFLNVNLGVSAVLPIDDREAVIRFSLASRESPFLIACPPYGGGGYFAMDAAATRIVATHAAFEFGAVVGIKFGPLNGQGRVTAGIYLDKYADGSTKLGGFVHAVGEGHVACFGVCVNIEVGVEHEDGHMTGYSDYSLTFSVGFAHLRFHFRATYTVSGSESHKKKPPINALNFVADPGCCTEEARAARLNLAKHPYTAVRLVPEKSHHWAEYRSRFDLPAKK